MRDFALGILREGLGPSADFREGQWEAIEPLLEKGSRLLVVQKTGWGKSIVYFAATRLLRKQGRGPTLIVSPLLALMRNQLEMATRFGLRAVSLNSTNSSEWQEIESSISSNAVDVLLVSPERLGNPGFRERVLPKLEREAGLFVIDEAHCISDWGHDFRPDYRRILGSVARLNPSASILATTATANNRVIEDIRHQLGENLSVVRGPLMRESLKLSVFRMQDQAERLAWLATYVPKLPGTGIIYTLTVNDAKRVAAWLKDHGIEAEAYSADIETESKLELETRFARNEVKALVATTALGMGYDKPDVRFVVHYQRPGSVINYYQQVGRAGRDLQPAFGVLLEGGEDDEINDYFIDSAFPDAACFQSVMRAMSRPARSIDAVVARTNERWGKVEKALRLLEVDGAVYKSPNGYDLRNSEWQYESLRSSQITSQRRQEAEQMREYVLQKGCRMEFLARALDDTSPEPCGKCDNCKPHAETHIERSLILEAISFLQHDRHTIEPRQYFPAGFVAEGSKKIPEEERLLPGVALCVYNDAGWGALVREAKYSRSHFPDELIEPSVDAIRKLAMMPDWLTWVPSKSREGLVPDFAKRLAAALGIEAVDAIQKAIDTPPQKEMQNSATQFSNVWDAFTITETRPGICLLVDDVVDSGWTMTAIGIRLRRAGSGPVVPFALASSKPRGDA